MEIIASDQGNHITTLYVAFTNEERLIGDAAKNRLRPPYGTVYDVNRSSAASSPTRRFSATRRWSISRSSTTPAQSLGMSFSLCVPLRPVPAPCAPAPCFFFGVNSACSYFTYSTSQCMAPPYPGSHSACSQPSGPHDAFPHGISSYCAYSYNTRQLLRQLPHQLLNQSKVRLLELLRPLSCNLLAKE